MQRIGNIYGEMGTGFAGNVWSKKTDAPTLQTMQGGNRQPMIIIAMRKREGGQRLEMRNDGLTNAITTVSKDNMLLIKQATKKGYAECKIGGVADLNYSDSKTRRARVQNEGDMSPAICTENIPSVLEDWEWEIDGERYRIMIRRLSSLECWKLMGFSKEDYLKAQAVNSDTQLYKQCGNSIVLDVLKAIIGEMI